MGEPTCVMPPPFSYTSGASIEANQGNPLHSLGESVSFGRFMTESLAWEKWSSFSQNRHVEEAERYAKPGSVAEKKAFFEAHYKRIAAKKAAALLEQANAANNNQTGSGCNETTSPDSETKRLSSQVVDDDQEKLRTQNNKENFIVNVDHGRDSNAATDEMEIGNMGSAEVAKEPEVLGEIAFNIKALDQEENVEDKIMVSGLDKPLLKDVSPSGRKKRAVLSSLKSTMFRKVISTPAKPMPPVHPRKENNFGTPSITNSTVDSADKKISTPKSLHNFINFTPARESNKYKPAARKTESSTIASTSYKASKVCVTPLRTPATGSLNGVPRHPSITPSSETERANVPLDPSATGSKINGPRWHLLSSVCSKSISACRKKLQSSTLSTPFTLRTEERAARRKQKLEDRFNEKEAQKVQKQTNDKENAEEVGKLRQTFCFRARPLPEFYRERETSKKLSKKAQEMHPQSHAQGKKPDPNTTQGTKPLGKSSTSAFKNLLKKNSQPHHTFSKVQH